jgi:signal transduction histidine kinase
MLLLRDFNQRVATVIRLVGLALVTLTVLRSNHPPATSGRGLIVAVALAVAIIAWVAWVVRPRRDGELTPDIWVMATAGGLLTGASPASAASVFMFVAVATAGVRVEVSRAFAVEAVSVLTLAVAILVYNGSGLGLLAYSLGLAAALLGASNARQSVARAEQAEVLLAQTQRSHEEQVRAARLEESTRIAREIHDVLAHALAGLAIQLEATRALVEQGAGRDVVLARVERAHELAREGLRETRRAVGALRGDEVSAPGAIEALVAEYRETCGASAGLSMDGDPARLAGPTGEAVLRTVQEALTNARKHAPGAGISVVLHAGASATDEVVLTVDDHPQGPVPPRLADSLASSGGGYGLQGMRERAELLGGSVSAGANGDGWRVELRLPPPAPFGERGLR